MVNWVSISIYQKLSEDFIDRNSERVFWDKISKYQKLSENFIDRNSERVFWNKICKYQKLSENFIEKHIDKIDMDIVSQYQYLSPVFRRKHNIRKFERGLYKKVSTRKSEVVDCGLYECHEDYFVAYKGIRRNNYSKFNFQYQYLAGETYHCHADHSKNSSSFGLSAWTREKVSDYCDEKIVKVKIFYKDLACLTRNNKVRCTSFTVMEEI